MERRTEITQTNGRGATIANVPLRIIPVHSPTNENQCGLKPVTKGFQLHYKHQNGCLYQGNSFDWLESLNDASVDLVFADPPYNIKKAEWDNFDSQENRLNGLLNG